MRSLWAAGMLLRRLRSEGGVILLIFLLVAGTSFVFAAAPRLFNRVSDDALGYAVRVATPVQRTISATLTENIGAGEGDAVSTIRERGEGVEEQFPPAIDSLISQHLLRFTTSRFVVRDPPSYDTRLLLRYQDGFTEATRLVSGRWPEDRGARLQTEVLGEGPDDPDGPPPPSVFEAAISSAAAAEVGVELGDHLALSLDPSDPLLFRTPYVLKPTEIEVVGLYEPLDATATYWFADTGLLLPEQRGDPDNPIAYVWAYVPPAMYPNLAGSELRFQYEWRFPIEPERVTADKAPQLQADFRRLGVNTGGAASGSTSAIQVRSGMPAILERFAIQRAQTETILSIATLGPFGLAAGAIAMVALLLVRRRRATVALARGRGASGSLVLGTQLWESILVAGAGTLSGLALAVALIPARGAPLSVTLAIAVGVVATLLLVGASWSSARRPLGNLERDDMPLTRVTARRLVVEATIVFLALAATLLLRERGLAGTGSATGGTGAGAARAAGGAAAVDPLLAAVPVLAGLAAGIVALRLYPLPIRALGWLAARRRDFVPVLGLRTIGRHPGAANLPLLVLLLTAAFGAFASTLAASIDRGQVTASYLDVGADYRVERVGFSSMPTAADLAAVPGVAAVAGGVVDSSAAFESNAGQLASVYLLAVDPAAYAAVLAGLPADPMWPGAMLAAPDAEPGTPDRPIPALLSARLPAGSSTLDAGDLFELDVVGRTLTFAVAERRATFPGIDARSPFAVVPLNWVQAAFERGPAPDVLFVRGGSEVRPGLKTAIAQAAANPRITSRYDAYAALRDAPLEAVIPSGYTAALIVAAIYMALAIVGAMVLSAAGRTRDLAYLRTLGVTARQALGLTVMEHGPPVVLALIPGIALGIAIAVLVEPGLGLATFVGTSGVPLYVDWPALAAMATALIGVVAVAVALGTWLARRTRPTDALRIGEH